MVLNNYLLFKQEDFYVDPFIGSSLSLAPHLNHLRNCTPLKVWFLQLAFLIDIIHLLHDAGIYKIEKLFFSGTDIYVHFYYN